MKKIILGIATFVMLAVMCVISAGAETYGDYEYEVLNDGSVEITGYNGSASKLDIPSKINGKSVTKIGSSAFFKCETLTSVTIPDGVTTLDRNCFYWCTKLTTVKIPDSVTTIGNSAFYYCFSLTSVKIPDSVTTIGHGAFNSCSSITSIVIPGSVTSLGDYAFRYCTSLKSITLPDSITIIDENTFYACLALTSISIPDSVKSIGEYAFSGCESLKSVTIPANVKSIGEEAFGDCESLKSVTVIGNFTSIGKRALGYDGYDYDTDKHIIVDGFVINCREGSYAHKYAVANGMNYKLIVPPADMSGFEAGGRASDAIRLNWKKNTSADGYIIEVYKGSKWVRAAKIASNATTTYRVTGLKAGTAYKFRMRAYKMYGSKALYSPYTNTVSEHTYPSVVAGFKLGGRGADALRLNWTKNTSADGYIVEQYKSGKWTRIAKITSNATTTYRVTGLKASTQYKFRVRAYKMNGDAALYSGYTGTLSAYTNPTKVANLKITGKATTALRLGWSKNTSADGYIVEMYSDGKWTRVAKITSNATVTFRKSDLTKGTTYKFRVKTYNMVGKTVLYGGYVNVSGTTNK